MTVKVIKDHTANILAAIQATIGKKVLIGIPVEKSNRNTGSITNAEIGYIHERGSPARNIPPRPFLVPGVKDAGEKCAAVLKPFIQESISGRAKIDQGLNAAGLIAQSSVKNKIRKGEGFAPLAESTIRARAKKGKAGTKPLIRTGQLLDSISYVIKAK